MTEEQRAAMEETLRHMGKGFEEILDSVQGIARMVGAVPPDPLPSEGVLARVLELHDATGLGWVFAGVVFSCPFNAANLEGHFRRVVAEWVLEADPETSRRVYTWRLYFEAAVVAKSEHGEETVTGDPVTLAGFTFHPWPASAAGELVLLRAHLAFRRNLIWIFSQESADFLEDLAACWRKAGVDVEWTPRGHVLEGEPVAFNVPSHYRVQVMTGACEYTPIVAETPIPGAGPYKGTLPLRFKPNQDGTRSCFTRALSSPIIGGSYPSRECSK